MARRDWSPADGAWRLKLSEIGRHWVWELYNDDPHIMGSPYGEPGLIDYGNARSRQKAINKAARARQHWTKKNIPKSEEEIQL